MERSMHIQDNIRVCLVLHILGALLSLVKILLHMHQCVNSMLLDDD
jgi:hypothetical protein